MRPEEAEGGEPLLWEEGCQGEGALHLLHHSHILPREEEEEGGVHGEEEQQQQQSEEEAVSFIQVLVGVEYRLLNGRERIE